MRTFIGIKLPEKIKEDIYEIISHLKESRANVKWVERENLHITLKFVGEINEDLFHKMEEQLKVISFNPFEIVLNGCGVFPNYYRPRVLWIGINFKENTLESLFNKIEDILLPLGINKEERSFKPHLTLGRVKSSKNKENLIKRFREDKIKKYHSSFMVENFTLFESVLKKEGPIYIDKMTCWGMKDNGC